MSKQYRLGLRSMIAAMLAIGNGFATNSGAQLLSNDSFEAQPVGTAVVIGTNAVVNTTTFYGWRIFSVGTPPMSSFSVTAVTNASAGNIALRMDMVNTGAGAGADHGVDRSNAKIPIAYGTDYMFSFDAAWISGSTNLRVNLAEFNAAGTFLGKQTSYPCMVSNSAYRTFTFAWTPLTNAATQITIAFRQQNADGETSSSMLLDNVRFSSNLLAWTAGGFSTPKASFAVTNHLVSTSVFQWFTSTTGQLISPWEALGGRTNWTGEPDWWKSQIKQMMMANIDVLYVHLIPTFEQQRINLFQALNQLRYEGYDVPKVAPFLDPPITWKNKPLVDVGTEAGKDEMVGQYIRFFNQYYSVNQDPDADDYIARYDNRVVLDSWTIKNNLTNWTALTRQDVTSRLAAELGQYHPFFNNDIYMVNTAIPDTFGFADEIVEQFSSLQYYEANTLNGITSVQLKGGYWDQNIRNPGKFSPRNGGSPFSNAWGQVDRNTARRVYIESWNEYNEGTGIYAAEVGPPYIHPGSGNTNTDVWSSSNDPFEYIHTTAAGAAAFNDTPARNAKILWHNFPATMHAGETQTVHVVVRNEGDVSWTAAANYKFGEKELKDPVRFGTNRYLLDDAQDEIPVYGGIFRGRSKAFQLTLVAPTVPGNYLTHWGMLQEHVAWFGEELAYTFAVVKAPASVVLGDLLQTYDGAPKNASATTAPPGLVVELTYDGSTNAPVDAGSYTVVGIINDAQYQGGATNTLVIQTPYEAWKTNYFSAAELTNSAISGETADPDGDGMNNGDEYISGTNPTNTQSLFSIQTPPGTVYPNGYVMNWTSVSGRVYSVYWTSNLLDSFSPLQTNIAWPQSSYTDQTHGVQTEGFYRMDVHLP